MLVQEFVGVQNSVHPVNADFDQGHVENKKDRVGNNAANLLNSIVEGSGKGFKQPFVHHRKHDVKEHALLRQNDLVPNSGPGRSFPILKSLDGRRMNIDKVMKRTRCSIVDQNACQQVAQIAQDVVQL